MSNHMKTAEKIRLKATDLYNQDPVTIAFLGDSVTHGVFEVYPLESGMTLPAFDADCVYHAYFKKMINTVFPGVPLNIINAGINGSNAPGGAERLERDVLRFHPDLTVVCFGLNDATAGLEGLGNYAAALDDIFSCLQENGSEVIFMTPNMFNTGVSIHVTDEKLKKIAGMFMDIQNNGIMDQYMETARETCKKHAVPVCDCYAKWKKLQDWGADITALLSNYLNHPIRELHYLFASSLFETIFFE